MIEEARILTHLARAYYLKNDLRRAYMVALEQLNAAEEAEEDWIEVNYSLVSYITIMCSTITISRIVGAV